MNGNLNMTTNVSANMPKSAINAKAGMPGVRPRPFKKQRMVRFFFSFNESFYSCNGIVLMEPFTLFFYVPRIQDIQGQARDVAVAVQQQPTPQGV
jgi:hypothetical protein